MSQHIMDSLLLLSFYYSTPGSRLHLGRAGRKRQQPSIRLPMEGNPEAARVLLAAQGRFSTSAVNAVEKHGNTALHTAALRGHVGVLVAQCSATPATVPATPPCSATPFQTQISVRHLPGMGGGGRCDTKIFRGCGATPLLHLQNAIKSRKSAATRVARHV